MADTALRRAEARRDALALQIGTKKREIEELQRELDRARRFISEWHDFAGTDAGEPLIEVFVPEDGATIKPRARPQNPPKEKVVALAREIISAKGHPVSRKAIFAYLEEKDIHLEGTDPQMVLSTMLWRMQDQVVRLGTKGYWLAEVPYPPLGYEPLTEEVRAEYGELSAIVAQDRERMKHTPTVLAPERLLLHQRAAELEQKHPSLRPANAFD